MGRHSVLQQAKDKLGAGCAEEALQLVSSVDIPAGDRLLMMRSCILPRIILFLLSPSLPTRDPALLDDDHHPPPLLLDGDNDDPPSLHE